MTTLEDAELLRLYAEEKSEAAFAELVRRHVSPVYAFALRRVRGDAHLAEDVVQVVFATLARKAATLRGRAVLGGWLCRAAHFAARNLVRAQSRRRAQRSEWELHQGPLARRLGNDLGWVEHTPAQFRALFPMVQEFTQVAESAGPRATPPVLAAGDRMMQHLVDTFGYDRAPDFIWAHTSVYSAYARIALEENLPPTTAARITQLSALTGQEASLIHADPARSVEEKRAALQGVAGKSAAPARRFDVPHRTAAHRPAGPGVVHRPRQRRLLAAECLSDRWPGRKLRPARSINPWCHNDGAFGMAAGRRQPQLEPTRPPDIP